MGTYADMIIMTRTIYILDMQFANYICMERNYNMDVIIINIKIALHIYTMLNKEC